MGVSHKRNCCETRRANATHRDEGVEDGEAVVRHARLEGGLDGVRDLVLRAQQRSEEELGEKSLDAAACLGFPKAAVSAPTLDSKASSRSMRGSVARTTSYT